MKFFSRPIIFTLLFLLSVFTNAQSLKEIKWAGNGSSYYDVNDNNIIRYDLPLLKKAIIIDSSKLIPAGQNNALPIEDFTFSSDEKKLLIFTNSKKVWRRNTRGDYWVLDLANNSLKQLGKGKPASSLMFAKISPDGTKAAYVSGHNLYVEDLNTNVINALTHDGTARLINGTFDWAYEEEFDCRDGFRWSPDSKNIAYWQIDATKIKNFLLIDNTDSLYSFTIPIEYPKVGQNPSPAKIGVVNISTAKTVWMNLPGDPVQHYIPRMEWAANSADVVLEQLNRKQNEARVFLCNATTGLSTQIYTETDKAWIDVKARWSEDPTGWEWINGGKEFLWVSEKDGWRHVYRVARNGKEIKITNGNYDIINIESIDEKNGFVYFMASPDNATQQYLYRTKLDGKGKAERISPLNQNGTHAYDISPQAKFAFHTFSNYYTPNTKEWISLPDHSALDGHKVYHAVTDADSSKSNTSFFKIKTSEGVEMDGWMVKPDNFDSTKKYPVLFYVYTEPAGTTVKDAAGVTRTRLYAGDIAADGYIQISLDGRGSPAPKGAAWRKAVYRKVGIVNVRDQAMAAKEIMKWKYVDTSRIAVWGWSGGGSTTLNLLFHYPEIYKTGIAIAPVADRLLYDNIYEERYMGLPQENLADYINASALSHAKDLRGNLLVIHGTGDDNVHYQGTEMLINELIKNNKYFELMSYPNRTHSISEGEGTKEHLSTIFTKYLKEHCPPGAR